MVKTETVCVPWTRNIGWAMLPKKEITPMELTDIYEKGRKAFESKRLALSVAAVETGFIVGHDRRILDRYTFRTQYIDAPQSDTACNILGVDLATPVIMSGITHPIPAISDDGLSAVAQGLKEAGSLMWTGSPIPDNLKELAVFGVPVAANVKPYEDRSRIFKDLEEIQKAGVTWVGIETDAGQGTKLRDRVRVGNCSSLSLGELKEIRRNVSCPLFCKGILSGRDAEKCVEAGVDGLTISNHGAHTIDYLPHPLQVMEEITAAVGDSTILIVDGGFRRGSDVLKGLAFGAHLVGLGRPILFALAADGQEGVYSLINEITIEMKRIMNLTGAKNTSDLSRDMLIED